MGEAVAGTRKITIEVEVPEEAAEIMERMGREKLARTAVKVMIANLLAAEAGLTREEAAWLEAQVKKELARKR